MNQWVKFGLIVILLVGLVGLSMPGQAMATNGKGKIEFYNESSSSTQPSSTTSSSSTPVPTPGGKLPHTGELVGKGIAISGIILLLIAFILLFRRRKEQP